MPRELTPTNLHLMANSSTQLLENVYELPQKVNKSGVNLFPKYFATVKRRQFLGYNNIIRYKQTIKECSQRRYFKDKYSYDYSFVRI